MHGDEDIDGEFISDEDFGSDGSEIYCANCSKCKVVATPTGYDKKYQLRVRCDAGRWKKKLGEEKTYKYFTVARRKHTQCEDYDAMGDEKDFLRDLRKSLPISDEVYISR